MIPGGNARYMMFLGKSSNRKIGMTVFLFIIMLLILILKPIYIHAADTPSYDKYNTLYTNIKNEEKSEVQFVVGTYEFPTAIDVRRSIDVIASGDPAIFIMNSNDSLRNLFVLQEEFQSEYERHFVIWPKDGETINITFKNIIFRTTNGSGGISIPSGRVKIIFEGCFFEGLGDEEQLYGGVLGCFSWLSNHYYMMSCPYKVEFLNCVFIDNIAFVGAVVHATLNSSTIHYEELKQNSYIKMNECLFVNNVSYTPIVYDGGMGILSFNNCVEVDKEVFHKYVGDRLYKNGNVKFENPGFSLGGWLDENGETILPDFVTGDLLFATPIWIPNEYSIIYNGLPDGIEFDLPSKHIYGIATILNSIEQVGYIFKGWVLPNSEEPKEHLTLDATTYFDNIYVTAIWELIPPSNSLIQPWVLALIIVSSALVAIGGTILIVLNKTKPKMEYGVVEKTIQVDDVTDKINDLATKHYLTTREKEIAILIVNGKSQIMIADELCISVETVKTHIKNLYGKVGIHKKHELFEIIKK